jgi:phosphohistidine phosphatase
MKRLVLIRHAKTEVIHDDITDLQRRLKKRGESDALEVAQLLRQKGYHPQLMVCSHAIRAFQTAKILADEIGYDANTISEERFIYDGYTTGDFIDFLNSIDNAIDELWVVGHNPDIAMIAMKLAHQTYFNFPTCATVVIDFNCQSWGEVDVLNGREALFIKPSEL